MESYWTNLRRIQSKVREHVEAINCSGNDNNYDCSIDSVHVDEDVSVFGNIENLAERENLGNLDHTDLSASNNSLENTFDINEGFAWSSESDTSSDTDFEDDTVQLTEQLVAWVSKFNISHSALNALLSILRIYHGFLPKDARTMLKTALHYNILSIAGGSYYHFGIEVWVKSIINSLPLSKTDVDEVSLQINIDGLPLFKSSNMQLWPILGRLVKPSVSRPFVIGLYCGIQKPTNVQEYLEKLVLELQDLFKMAF